jgi:hypothetical protein
MNHPWQQPIRPLEYQYPSPDDPKWYRVLFIRPMSDEGEWQLISMNGILVDSMDFATLREVEQ